MAISQTASFNVALEKNILRHYEANPCLYSCCKSTAKQLHRCDSSPLLF